VKALQVLERTVGSKHPLLGITTHMFASFLVDAGKVVEAKPFYERALKIKASTPTPQTSPDFSALGD